MKISSNRNKTRFWLFNILFAVILFVTAMAQTSLIEVTAEVDKSVITIGDRITYSLKIKRDKNLKIEQPGPAANLGMFEIKDYDIHDPVEENGTIVEQFDYVISVYDTGKFVIPPFPVAFFPSDTSKEYQIIKSEPIDITVKSLLSAENNEIKDIKPPLLIPINYWRIIVISGGSLILIAVIIFVIYYYKRKKQGKPLFRKEIIRPAHEIAFEDLEQLIAKSYLEEKKYKEFFSELSNILRHYLENRFFITAMEETTTELLESLQEIDLQNGALEKVREVLDLSDLIKFAKYEPQKHEIEKTIELTKDFIHITHLEFKAVEFEEEADLPSTEEENEVPSEEELEKDNQKNTEVLE